MVKKNWKVRHIWSLNHMVLHRGAGVIKRWIPGYSLMVTPPKLYDVYLVCHTVRLKSCPGVPPSWMLIWGNTEHQVGRDQRAQPGEQPGVRQDHLSSPVMLRLVDWWQIFSLIDGPSMAGGGSGPNEAPSTTKRTKKMDLGDVPQLEYLVRLQRGYMECNPGGHVGVRCD